MGIPIKIHVSLLLILLVLVMRFGFVTGALLELGLATSIVLHELGHSAIAIRKGCRVREITLLAIGGAAQMDRLPTRPLDEFIMAVAGPLVSFSLGVGIMFAGYKLPLPRLHPLEIFQGANFLQIMGGINIGLALFNLVPAFPMDGGRVLRAVLTPRLGRLRATLAAARLGQIMAICAAIFALASFPRNWILLLISIFVFFVAGHESRMVARDEKYRQDRSTSWDRTGNLWSDTEDGDDVIISPPPYRRGPDAHAEIREEREDPFRELFG